MVEQLSHQHQCILLKLPGHGGAPEPDDFMAPTIETELQIIEAVVKHLTDQPIHLVGHSIGGIIALAQALKGNLRISQLTLFEPVAFWVFDAVNDPEMRSYLHDFLKNFRRDVSQNVPYACSQVIDFWSGEGSFQSLPDFIKTSMEPLVKNNIRHWGLGCRIETGVDELRACLIPTRLVYGDQSSQVTHAILQHLHNEMSHAKCYMIKGANHFLVTSHVQECLQALLDPIT